VSNITLKCPRSIEVSTNRRLGTGWPARRSRKGSWLAAVIAAAILLGAGLAVAQTREANLLAMDNPVRVAPVTIDGRILFQVRGVSAFPRWSGQRVSLAALGRWPRILPSRQVHCAWRKPNIPPIYWRAIIYWFRSLMATCRRKATWLGGPFSPSFT
jgi:hypothetical protein